MNTLLTAVFAFSALYVFCIGVGAFFGMAIDEVKDGAVAGSILATVVLVASLLVWAAVAVSL
jgi:hypothetical protein